MNVVLRTWSWSPKWILTRGLVSVTKEADLQLQTRKLLQGLYAGERQALARAITLVESTNKNKATEGKKLVNLLTYRSTHGDTQKKNSFRIGLSGPPGAGKSTFIEAFGTHLTETGYKIAVLAVDPSSGTTGGSLLGDKTRMPELARNPSAYIRPSPNRGHLGGVTRTTNEAIVLCEAAGYDIVIVETVGVGQSEYLVADMVDMFCLILPPAGGDELQGIKRGIVEQSDLIIINKCDGDLVPAARRIKSEYTSALKFMRPRSKLWRPKVKMMSSLTKDGLSDVWGKIQEFEKTMTEEGELSKRRAKQHKKWMWNYINDRLLEIFNSDSTVREQSRRFEEMVMRYKVSPGTAADALIDHFLRSK